MLEQHSYPLSSSKVYVTSAYRSPDMVEYPNIYKDYPISMPNYLYKIERDPPLF